MKLLHFIFPLFVTHIIYGIWLPKYAGFKIFFLSLQYWFPMRTFNIYIKKACLGSKAHEGRKILIFGVIEKFKGWVYNFSMTNLWHWKEGGKKGRGRGRGRGKERQREGGREREKEEGKGGPSVCYWNTREPTQESNCRSYCSFIVCWKCHSEWQLLL